ncbi:MAG TPA: methyltransferase domain-containing protein [Anaerovoracaceae bacterium]|nr:methyltransferase domain-containing protein [Anaerovoracaceae bacterium]
MNRFNEKSARSYNEKADHYDSTPEGRFTLEFKHKLLEEISVNRGAYVLDVACGNGTLIKMLADRYGIIGYGTDISEKMIENARRKNPEMIFETAGCESMPFENQFFDLITVCAAYHHFPDVKAFAAEAHRLIKTEGCLYIADVYYPALVRFLCNPFVPLSKAGDVRFYSPKEIRKTFEKSGFRMIDYNISGHIQLVAFQKK